MKKYIFLSNAVQLINPLKSYIEKCICGSGRRRFTSLEQFSGVFIVVAVAVAVVRFTIQLFGVVLP